MKDQAFKIQGDFNSPQLKYEKIGRGEITIEGTVLTSQDAYAALAKIAGLITK